MPVKRSILALAILGFVPTVSFAQSVAPALVAQPAPGAPPAAAAPLAGANPAASQVDTSALVYYAQQHDTPRVEAELRRLRSLYPNWQPPADPATLADVPTDNPEERALWDMFSADKLDDLDAELAKRRAENPAYTPPPELVSKLADKRTRQQLLAASDRKDFAAVLDIATKNPGLVTADDLDVSWRVAEAYGRTGASDQALKLNQTILASVQDPTARLATVRKAMAALPSPEIDQLVTMGRPDVSGRSEFDAVDLDLVRRRVGRVLAGNVTEAAAPHDLERLEVAARTTGGAGDAALLGWWNAKQQDWTKANDWFQMALKAGPSPEQAKPEDARVAQGAALALRSLERKDDAENLAYQWRNVDPALALLYIDSVDTDLTKPKPDALPADRLQRFSDVVMAQQSGDGAQALGWYAYNVAQFKPARAWFKKAMAWQPRDTTALGLALSMKQLNQDAELEAFLAENEPQFPALAALSEDNSKPKPGDNTTMRRRRGATRSASAQDDDDPQPMKAPPPRQAAMRSAPVADDDEAVPERPRRAMLRSAPVYANDEPPPERPQRAMMRTAPVAADDEVAPERARRPLARSAPVYADDEPVPEHPRRAMARSAPVYADDEPAPEPRHRAPVRSAPVAADDEPPAERPRRATVSRNNGRRAPSPCAGGMGVRGTTSASLQSGWCLMSLNRPQEAAAAFSAAQSGPATRVDGAYGEALAALRSNRTDEAVMAANSGGLTTARRNEIGLAALAQKASMTFDQGKYEDTLRALDQRRMFVAEPRDLAILRAWSTYHTGHSEEARTMFSNLDGQMSTTESRAGIAATNQPSRY